MKNKLILAFLVVSTILFFSTASAFSASLQQDLAQNTTTLHGAMLRIDVDSDDLIKVETEIGYFVANLWFWTKRIS